MSDWHLYLKIKSTQIVFLLARLGDSALLMQVLAQWMDVEYSFKPEIFSLSHLMAPVN